MDPTAALTLLMKRGDLPGDEQESCGMELYASVAWDLNPLHTLVAEDDARHAIEIGAQHLENPGRLLRIRHLGVTLNVREQDGNRPAMATEIETVG